MPIKNKETYNAYMRDWRRNKKQKMIADLGAKCERCKDDRTEFLAISQDRVLCNNCLNFLRVKKGRQTKSAVKK